MNAGGQNIYKIGTLAVSFHNQLLFGPNVGIEGELQQQVIMTKNISINRNIKNMSTKCK